MSTNVIEFRARQTRQVDEASPWRLSTALGRLGFVRIALRTWPDGAESFGLGRFVAVHPDCPTPTRSILVEVARLSAGPHRTWPYAGETDVEHPNAARAGLVADCVRSLAESHGPVDFLRSQLAALPLVERERVVRLARRIHEAGLERIRPGAIEQGVRPQVTRGKPGHRRPRLRA